MWRHTLVLEAAGVVCHSEFCYRSPTMKYFLSIVWLAKLQWVCADLWLSVARSNIEHIALTPCPRPCFLAVLPFIQGCGENDKCRKWHESHLHFYTCVVIGKQICQLTNLTCLCQKFVDPPLVLVICLSLDHGWVFCSNGVHAFVLLSEVRLGMCFCPCHTKTSICEETTFCIFECTV